MTKIQKQFCISKGKSDIQRLNEPQRQASAYESGTKTPHSGRRVNTQTPDAGKEVRE